jgi:hypothetical protein
LGDAFALGGGGGGGSGAASIVADFGITVEHRSWKSALALVS